MVTWKSLVGLPGPSGLCSWRMLAQAALSPVNWMSPAFGHPCNVPCMWQASTYSEELSCDGKGIKRVGFRIQRTCLAHVSCVTLGGYSPSLGGFHCRVRITLSAPRVTLAGSVMPQERRWPGVGGHPQVLTGSHLFFLCSQCRGHP